MMPYLNATVALLNRNDVCWLSSAALGDLTKDFSSKRINYKLKYNGVN